MIMTRSNGEQKLSPYPTRFNSRLKKRIRERDDNTCQECGVIADERAHHVHHIDYVKANLDESNLITLCHSCHAKTTNPLDQQVWIDHFQRIMVERGLTQLWTIENAAA